MSAVAARPNVKRFRARRSELVLTKTPIQPIHGPDGRPVDQRPGEKVAFTAGVLEVPLDEGAVMTMVDGREIAAVDVLRWLEGQVDDGGTRKGAHHLYDDLSDGFFEIKEVAPVPGKAELDALQDLAIYHDLEGLEAFVAAERAGWDRQELIAVAGGTIERVHAAQERLVQQQRADAEAVGAALAGAEDAAAGETEAAS